MVKTIIFSKEPSKEMTYEEVREQFLPLLNKTVNRSNQKFNNGILEKEDFLQELEISLWIAYEKYDPGRNNCFSTYLHYRLMKGVDKVVSPAMTLKRKNDGVLSLDVSLSDDGEMTLKDTLISDFLVADDYQGRELYEIIQTAVGSEHEEILFSIIDPKAFPVSEYAKKNHITRQGASQRVRKIKRQLRKKISLEYLGI